MSDPELGPTDWGERAERWAGIRTVAVDVRGTRVRTLQVDGPSGGVPQLLVHGLGGVSTNWLEVARSLASHGPVVAPDLPGFGRTEPPHIRAARVPNQVRFLGALVAKLGWSKVVVHGNSMGGLISLLFAARFPELVDRLVLVSPALPTPVREIRSVTPRTLARFAPFLLPGVGLRVLEATWRRVTDEQLWEDSLDFVFAEPERLAPEVHDNALENLAYGREHPWRMASFVAAAESVVSHVLGTRRVNGAAGDVACPTLLVYGDADQLVSAAAIAAVAARRPDWELTYLPGCGHVPQLERPDEYLGAVEAFLARDGAGDEARGSSPAREVTGG